MPLDVETIKVLRKLREDIEELLNEIRDMTPPNFLMTLVMRYVGGDQEIKNMIWTEDVHDDVVRALETERDDME